jgi:hypothetical protein
MHRQQTEARITGKLGRLFQVLSIALLTSCWATTNAQVVTTGSETLVNTTTANSQQNPAVAMDTAGNYIVVWESFAEDGDDYGIYGQLYTAGGTANGSQFKISQTTSGEGGQRLPDVDMADNGDFVVVWMSDGEDNDGFGIYGRRYNSDGSAKANDFRINSGSADEQTMPKVGVAGTSGNMVFTWVDEVDDGDEQGLKARLYLSNGAATSAPYIVNTTTAGYQSQPDISMNSDGDHVITWQGEDADGMGVFAQRYDNNSVPSTVGGEIAVNPTTAENQQEPSVAIDPSGNFIITWSSYAQDGDHYGIYGQIYDNAGSVTVAEFVVNTTTANSQNHSHSAATEDGLFYVSWTSWAQDGDKAGVYLQAFKADGALYGSEEKMNTRTNDFQQFGDVAATSETKEMVVVWQDGLRNSSSTNDGDDYGVYMQRSNITDVTPPVAVCQNITVYLDGTGNVTVAGTDVDNGSTDNCGIASYTLDVSSFTCNEIGANAVVLTVEDLSGNTDDCNATITVLDTVSPVASCQNLTVYLDGTGNANITDSDPDNGSTDNCGINTYDSDITAFTCGDIGANNVTLTVTDVSGNTASCVSIVTVVDTTRPVVACQNLTVYLDGTGNASITDTDVDNGSSDNCGIDTYDTDITAFTCSEIGANNVTLTVTDAGGNTASCVSVVTVLDTVSPVASCQNLDVYLDAAGNGTIADADPDNGSTDNCGIDTYDSDITSFTCNDVGANNVTLTVTDASGNTAACVSVVTVHDTVSPTISNCPSDINIATNQTGCTADVTWTAPTEADACAVSMISTHNSGDNFPLGATVVTYTATDASGNTAECSFTVTVTTDLNASATASNATCNGESSGSTNLTVTGGGSPYLYDWDNDGTGDNDDPEDLTAIPAGSYSVTVTDNFGCTAADGPVVVNEPDVPTISATPTAILITNSSTLSVDAGNLNGAADWEWYSGSCGGTPVGTGTSIVVSPTTTTTYYCRAEGPCVGSGGCASVTITVTAETKIRDADCGITLGSMTQYIYADLVSSANAYQFRFDDGSNTYTYIRSDGVQKIKPSWVTGLLNGTTYDVDVRTRIGSTWGNYGVICQITTPSNPTTQLSSTSCGVTLTDMDDYVYANTLSGADAYQFRFDDGSNTYTYIRNGGVASIKASWVTGLVNNTTYTVDVRARINSVWTAYGTTCQLSTPVTSSTTQLSTGSCGASVSIGTYVYCDAVTGADKYQFKLYNQSDPTDSLVTLQNTNKFKPSWVSGISNTTYDVKVRARVGTWSAYGSFCDLTVTGAASVVQPPQAFRTFDVETDDPFNALIYPNPSNGGPVYLEVTDIADDAKSMHLLIVDMQGKAILNEEIALTGKLIRRELDINDLADGVYMVSMQINDERIVKRMIITK